MTGSQLVWEDCKKIRLYSFIDTRACKIFSEGKQRYCDNFTDKSKVF